MRLLLTWLQVHPQIGEEGRVQVGAATAKDVENFETERRWDPDTDLDRAKLDAAMAANPPQSIDDLLALAAAELQRETGYHVAVQRQRPAPEPEPEPEPDAKDDAPAAPTG